jgi:PEP-CTERM motif
MAIKTLLTSLCVAALFQAARADQTIVTFDSGSQTVFNLGSTALTGGTSLDGDGAVLQLGYFSSATAANNFSGTWVALSGQTSLNTAIISGSNDSEPYNKTSIGDLTNAGAGDGTFALSLTFVAGDPTSGNSLPTAGTPLAIRFYNGTSIATSTFYNTVSADSWIWLTPQPSNVPNTVAITLDAANLEWESIVKFGQTGTTAFHTTIPVPEPSTITSTILGTGLLGGAIIRRRRKLS